MHQEHNIPWNLLAKNVKFVQDNPAYTPRTTGFFAKSPNAGELNHFVRALATTIRTFSDTERAKYPSPWPLPFPTSARNIYSDAVKERHPEYLDDERQKIETWIQRAHREVAPPRENHRYSTSHGDLADVVKVLFAEAVDKESDAPTRTAGVETLLTLANHPEIPLGTMVQLSWGHHFGWSRVMESALRTYVLFNLIIAVGTQGGNPRIDAQRGGGIGLLESGAYREMQFYSFTYRTETQSIDYDAQQIPHRKFWEDAGAAEQDSTIGGANCERRGKNTMYNNRQPPLMHLDALKLKEYLKLNFALLYMYDMIARECGMDPDWRGEITLLLNEMIQGLTVDTGRWLETEGAWSTPISSDSAGIVVRFPIYNQLRW
ncbi:hypothetical protein NMY22_g8010 [Coprinellus aureogranulatus]|nr:hypothetical protein NMY22_g8010 [Coprinellus aureogranulatus]